MNKMILRNQQELSCPCGNTRKAKPIRQAKARLLLILAALLFGGKGWGQTWPNGQHITGADGHWNLGWNGEEVVTISGTIYVESPIYVIHIADPNARLIIRPYNNGTCTIKRGGSYTGPIFKVMTSSNTGLPANTAGILVIEAGVTIDGDNATGVAELINVSTLGQCYLNGTSSKLVTLQKNKGGAINNNGTLTCDYANFNNNYTSNTGGAINSILSCTLRNCQFTSNSALDGGAIFAQNTLSMENCTLSSNTIDTSLGNGSGGAIYYGGSLLDQTATITGCTINGNTAGNKGGAIILHDILTYSKMTLSGNLIYNNTADYGGGIAVHETSTLTMSSGEIYKNTARNNGAGVHVMNGTTFTLNGGAIGKAASSSLNTATSNGGGVYNEGTFTMTAGSIFGGKAANGGGVYNAGTFNMNGGIVGGNSSYKNTATANGGGVYNTGTFSMGGNVTYNTATANGGGVYVASGSTFTMGSGTEISNNTATVDGAGLYLASNFTLTADRIIHTNTATKNGGGVYVASGVTFTMSGGIIHSNTSSNTAIGTGGGGVYTESGSTFSLSGGEIYHNTANSGSNGSGGGVLTNGTFNMSGGDIGRGEAIDVAANRNYSNHGGGVFVNAGTFTMSGTAKIHGNRSGKGGGVYVNTNSCFVMNNGEIHFNYAISGTNNNKGGGVYIATGGTFELNNGTIYSNQAKYSYTDGSSWGFGGGIGNSGAFTMTGGSIGKYENNARFENKGSYGGGVYTDVSFNCTGGTIAYNAGTSRGGGVYVASGTFSMDNSTIHDNTAGHGGGIYTLGSVTATDNNQNNNTKIYNNTATASGGDGGGVLVDANGSFTMADGEIYSNTTVDDGGGIYVSNNATSSLSLTNTDVYSNSATHGGGIYKCANAIFSISGGEVYSNTATGNGGGINIAGGTGTAATTLMGVCVGKVTNNVYSPNTAKVGGGIYMADGELTIQKNSTTNVKSFIIGNNANAGDGTGGGIHKEAGTISISDTEITGNTSLKAGGGLFSKGTTTITDCEITSNSATTTGGGIHLASGETTITRCEISDNSATTSGGGIHMATGSLTITDSEISGNTATTSGGGIHMVTNATNKSLTITGSEISGNTSLTNGGGVYFAAGTFNLSESSILRNVAITSGANIGYGGGVYSNGGTMNITGSNIMYNNALVNGGGIYKKGTVNVSGLVVINNNESGAAKTQITDNVYIHDGASQEYVNIAAAGLECGSCIGITKSHSYGTGNNSNVTEIVRGTGTAPVPANNCNKAYRNRFFFDDTNTHTVFNSTTSPYYNQAASTSLYFVKNTATNGKPTASSATNSWLYSADAAGCTIDGNGFVTAVNNDAGMAYFAKQILDGKDYSNKTVSLSADIDLSGHNWEPIGYAAECLEGNSAVFNGTFDGQGHTITNITCPFPYDNMGLFGAVGDDGVVKNTVVANINFTGTNTHTGAVAGLLNGAAYNCSAITQSGTGTTAASLVGEVGADGSLKNCFVNTSAATNGLADVNGGTIENCYMRGATNFVGSGSTGTVNYCYAPSGSVSGTNSVYGATDLTNSNKYGFAHSDQQIAANANNTHIVNGAIDNRGELKGLLATLNHWVKTSGNGWNADTQSNSNGYALWTRTMASPINGDYPVLMMPGTVCVGSADGTILNYAADINTLLGAYSSAGDIYLYATNPKALGGTSGTTRVYINEHVGVLQTLNTTVNARVGVTLDNSSTGYMSYDWHMFSPALTAAPLGIVYQSGVNDNYLVKTNYSTYLRDGIPHTVYESAAYMDPTKTTWNTTTGQIGYFPTNTPYGTWRGTPDPVGSFDFYCYHEPTCHWINFKREGTSSFYDHWRENEDPTTQTHFNIPYENESSLTPGKGYLVALSQPSMLMADGVLNNGDASGNVSINVTASDINFTGYEYTLKGINLIGNPYQSYLDFDEFASYSTNTPIGNTYYILDADKKGYVSYTVGQTDPPAPKMLHPHQGFYVKVPASQSLQFTPDMRATTGAVFRDDKPSYPLVNLVCTDGQGRNDFATVELDRPEAGGGEKVLGLHSGDASVWIHTDEADWQTAFTTPGLREVPVRFKAYKDGFFTISWNTMNADFNYMHLIDNLTGTDIDCLNADEYHFEGKVTDYSSRFRLVLEYTDVEENEDDASTGSATFAFMMGDELVVNSGSSTTAETALLEMFDLNGRCLLSKELHGEQSTLHMPTTAPGIYVFRLTANRQTRTQKMVIR